MLRLESVPDKIASETQKVDLGGAPNVADSNYWQTEDEKDYAIWPAHAGEKRVRVLIDVRELSALDGEPYAFDTKKISVALKKYRQLIEQRANDLFTQGSDVVWLEGGTLRGPK